MSQVYQKLIKDIENIDKKKLTTIRMVIFSIKKIQIDKKIKITYNSSLTKSIRVKQDSYNQSMQEDRAELIKSEKNEIEILIECMFKQLSYKKIVAISYRVCRRGAIIMKEIGEIIAKVKNSLTGEADINKVRANLT